MKKEVKDELWLAPWFIRGVLTVLWLGGIATIVALLFKDAYIHASISFIVFVAAIYYVSTPFRRYGSRYFSTEAVHFDSNYVEMDVAGVDYWNNDPAIKDYAGSLDFAEFKWSQVSERTVRIGELVQRLAVCIKISFSGTDSEKLINLFKSIRVLDSQASTEWRRWLKERLPLKTWNVVTALAIEGKLSRFFHEGMDGEFIELIQRTMKSELDLLGGGFVVKASYQLLDSNEEIDEFYLYEAADRAHEAMLLHPDMQVGLVPRGR